MVYQSLSDNKSMNIGALLSNTATIYPNQLGIIHGEKRLTYRHFNCRANQISSALLSLNINPGDSVALIQYNCPEMLESMFACFKAGFKAVPLNFRLHPNELKYIINHCQAKCLILSPEFNEDILNIVSDIPRVRHIISLSGVDDRITDYEELVRKGNPEQMDKEVEANEIAWIFYTSGTTGRPKGAMLSHLNLLMMTFAFYADYMQLQPGDATLHAAPLSHGSGLYSLPNVARAATNVILPTGSFDPVAVFKAIEKYKVSNMFAAPTMVKMLIDHPKIGQYHLKSLKSLIYGGGPIHVDDLKKAIAVLGPCLTQLYGMGECPMTITYLPHQDHCLDGIPEQMKRLASAGIARTGSRIRIVDQNNNELPRGQVGEVVTKSLVTMKGYYRDAEATAQTMFDGWLHTGDLGYIDSDGYLYLLDRSKDMIISGGENIYAREVEEVIIRHPEVREVAVIGIPDEKWGEAVLAVVTRYPGSSVQKEDLIMFCKGEIASYKKPKYIEFVDEIPKNNYGKVVKKELRHQYHNIGHQNEDKES